MKLEKMTIEQLADAYEDANKKATRGFKTVLGGAGTFYGSNIVGNTMLRRNNPRVKAATALSAAGGLVALGAMPYTVYQSNRAEKINGALQDREIKEGKYYIRPDKKENRPGVFIDMESVPKYLHDQGTVVTHQTLPTSFKRWEQNKKYLEKFDSSLDRSKMTLEELQNLKKEHTQKLKASEAMSLAGASVAGASLLGARHIMKPKGHLALTRYPGEVPHSIGIKSKVSKGALIGGTGLIGVGLVKNALNKSAIRHDNLAIEALKASDARKASPETDFEALI